MASNTTPREFTESETRADEMRETAEVWLEELTESVDEARASEEFREWLDVQSRFHDYSYRNVLLIKRQCSEATKVAGYRTWQTAFDRQVREGESAIWIWAPIIAAKCPGCGNGERYHGRVDCDESTPVDEWSNGLVGFRPAPVFDVSQTEGEPLPELDTAIVGEADDLVPRLVDIADDLDVVVSIVPDEEWTHGRATGVCKLSATTAGPVIEVRDRTNDADLAGTLVHEYAHALLHFDVDDEDERAKREIEAEAVAYVVGRYFELETTGSAFYLAAWASDDVDVLNERIERISRTATTIIESVLG